MIDFQVHGNVFTKGDKQNLAVAHPMGDNDLNLVQTHASQVEACAKLLDFLDGCCQKAICITIQFCQDFVPTKKSNRSEENEM